MYIYSISTIPASRNFAALFFIILNVFIYFFFLFFSFNRIINMYSYFPVLTKKSITVRRKQIVLTFIILINNQRMYPVFKIHVRRSPVFCLFHTLSHSLSHYLSLFSLLLTQSLSLSLYAIAYSILLMKNATYSLV